MNCTSEILEGLLHDLECPVCTEYMYPPIVLCSNGHNICKRCKDKVDVCPSCRGQLTNIRNVILENIARRQNFPCVNRERGCSAILPMDQILEHQAVCKYGKIKCPLNKIQSETCPWTGNVDDLMMHFSQNHKYQYVCKSSYLSDGVSDYHAIMFAKGEAFIFYKQFREEKLYSVVQIIGSSEDASNFTSTFTLSSSAGIEHVTATYFVRSFKEDVEDSFETGKCLILDRNVIRNFISNGNLNMTVEITRLQN